VFQSPGATWVKILIGVPKEIKNHEYRVGMTPLSVREAVRHGLEWIKGGFLRVS
jgi:hypothetical protein